MAYKSVFVTSGTMTNFQKIIMNLGKRIKRIWINCRSRRINKTDSIVYTIIKDSVVIFCAVLRGVFCEK